MPNLYPRHRLPQWTIEDVIKHDYSYYFGMELASNLQPCQNQEDYQQDKITRKYEMFKVGQFDPIIVDYQMNIVCGHHRHQMILDYYDDTPVPIICMEGVGIEDVVKYYESYCLHNDAQMDWLAEQLEPSYSHHESPYVITDEQEDWIKHRFG